MTYTIRHTGRSKKVRHRRQALIIQYLSFVSFLSAKLLRRLKGKASMKNNKPSEDFFTGLNWSTLMQSINDLGVQRLYSYSKSKRDSTSIAIERLSKEQEDQILDSYPQLIAPDYRAWCVKQLRAKGKAKFVELADRAVKYGKDPQRMFVYLLK